MHIRGHLMFAIPLYVLSVRYLSDAVGVLLSPYFAVYCFLTMIGSLFPDVDWIIMRVYRRFGHRNPLTHSLFFPLLFFVLISFFRIDYPVLLASYDAFIFGVASHLFGDLMQTSSLVWIRSRKYDNMWYFLNGFILLLLLYLTGFFRALQLAW